MPHESGDSKVVVTGIPSPVLYPAVPRKMEVGEAAHVAVPLKGVYPEGSPFKGEYDLTPEEGVASLFKVVEVLLGTGRYPKLREDERFSISVVAPDDDGNMVVAGNIIRLL